MNASMMQTLTRHSHPITVKQGGKATQESARLWGLADLGAQVQAAPRYRERQRKEKAMECPQRWTSRLFILILNCNYVRYS